ncbi:unnamed protein product [Soboliphyme baturini]|uniref:PH domain-containing protein n=1 Tax=Soboliphyme baturini TaxID=241478 RepID=A0A183INB3_9BILA|nr:unnamed protein product [Soboliphyme baturini]
MPWIRRIADVTWKEIPCRSLGSTDHSGWVHVSMAPHRVFSHHWTKRYIVLKERCVYIYTSPEDSKALNVVSLTGLTVSPSGPDFITTKPNVFVVKGVACQIYFSCEHAQDMITWLNKMGLAAIGYEAQTTSSKL